MKIKIPWKQNLESNEIDELESKLNAVLIPVTPRENFIWALQKRLLKEQAPDNSVTKQRNRRAFTYAVISLVGLLSGAVLIISGIRTVITILGSLGLLQQVGKSLDNPQHSSST